MGFWNDITGVTAANKAAAAQKAAAQKGIDFQQGMFDQTQEDMQPYMDAGANSLQQQQALSGALGPEAQQAAYDSVQNSAGFQSALNQGETTLLQNASATGGVRGGNTAGALAQYAPQLLNQAIDQRYSQLGGLTQMGQASAAGVGAQRMNMANNVASGMNNIGNAQAGADLGGYNLQKGFLGDVAGFGLNIAELFGKPGGAK